MTDEKDSEKGRTSGLDLMPPWVRVVLAFIVVVSLITLLVWFAREAMSIATDDAIRWARVLTVVDSGLNWIGIVLGAVLGVAVQAPRINDYRHSAKDAAAEAKAATAEKDAATITAVDLGAKHDRVRQDLVRLRTAVVQTAAASSAANTVFLAAPSRGVVSLESVNFNQMIDAPIEQSSIDPGLENLASIALLLAPEDDGS